MKRSTATFAALAVMAAVIAAALIYGYLMPSGSSATNMQGSLFVSDAGQSHGGFEYTASYNVTLQVKDGSGVMRVNLTVGLGDTLTKHEYTISNFQVTKDKVTMKVDGQTVELPWTSNDAVWNHIYDNSYIASWGSDAPPQEMRGTIEPQVFPGVPDTYYVELRLS